MNLHPRDDEGIWTTMSVCTWHITLNDSKILSDSYFCGQVVEHENGFIIWTPYDEKGFPKGKRLRTLLAKLESVGFSDSFVLVIRRAIELNCMLINLSGTGKDWSGLLLHNDW